METINICRFIGEYFGDPKRIDNGLLPNYYNLSRELEKFGVHTTILCNKKKGEKDVEEIDGIPVIRYGPLPPKISNFYFHYLMGKKAFEASKKIEKEIFHFHNFYGYWLQNFIKEPNVLTVHGSDIRMHELSAVWPASMVYPNLKAKYDLWATLMESKKMCRGATEVVGVSNGVSEEISKKWGLDNVSTIHNGINAKDFKRTGGTALKNHQKTFNIIYVGRVTPAKGIEYLFEAVDGIENVRLFLIGDFSGIHRQYFDYLVKKMENKNKITIVGSVPHNELANYYSSADCLVFPTLSEGFPKVLLEAMACECPMIATDIPGNNEVLNSKNGYLVEQKNSAQIKEKILHIMANPKEAKKKAKIAGGVVRENFTWRIAAQKYAALYKKVLAGGG